VGDAEHVARHFVTTNGMHPLTVLELVLRGQPRVEIDGFVRLEGTPLEVPGEFAAVTATHMATIAWHVLLMVKPPIEGVCLLASRKDHNDLCRAVWRLVRQYCDMPPTLTAVMRTQRGDLQRFVADVYGKLLRSTCDCELLESWVDTAVATPWCCVVGGEFLALVSHVARVAEIEHVHVQGGASLRLWGEHGLLVAKSDHILLFLLLSFWEPGLAGVCPSKWPADTPEPVKTALGATWLRKLSNLRWS
jgi:hypothetical protein